MYTVEDVLEECLLQLFSEQGEPLPSSILGKYLQNGEISKEKILELQQRGVLR